MNKLKDCPFCGSKVEVIEHKFLHNLYAVECWNHGGIVVRSLYCRTPEEAIAVWNAGGKE